MNASSYYVVEDDGRDWNEIKTDLQWAAKQRKDGKWFTDLDETEAGARWHRDAGVVFLEYEYGYIQLSRNVCISLYGKFILRPGYYEGATLDWDIEVNGPGDSWNLNEYDDINDMAGDIMEHWDWYERGTDWNAGIKKMQSKNIRKKIDDGLAGIVEALEGICADLVGDNVYQRGGLFSNGTCVYHKVSTERGRILAAV